MIRHHVDAFWSACELAPGRFRRPGLNKVLRNLLSDLRGGSSNQVPFPFEALKRLLRWCITEGRHLQDERRDNARALWRVLFKGRVPDFVRWNPATEDYEEDLDGYLRWCAAQVEPELETIMS
jgi:hypothetical protein